MKKGLLALLLVLVIGLIWRFCPRRWRRWILGGLSVLFAISMLLFSPSGVALIERVFLATLPPDRGEPVEAIVVLGRGMDREAERAAVAAELWQQKRAPLIFASGRRDAPLLVSRFKTLDIPSSALSGENCSATTQENAQYTEATLKSRGIQHILLVTDTPHLLRSFLVFRSVGFQVVPHANPLPAETSTFSHLGTLVREGFGLIGYWQRGYYQPNQSASLDSTTLEACRVEG